MATAKKLASGSWRCLVYDYTDTNGKRHYKSFTSSDPSPKGKREVEKQAAIYAANKENSSCDVHNADYTVKEALEAYCNIKSNVLSPSTLRGYRKMIDNSYGKLEHLRLSSLTNVTVQRWINELSREKSPKTVHNIYGLLSATLSMYSPDTHLRIQLPQKILPQSYVPSDADIEKIIRYFSENDRDMLIAVYLAAFGTLRRSEICALTSGDVNGNVIHVSKAVVEASDNQYVTKMTPKTMSSNRYIEMPDFVIQALPHYGKLVNLMPHVISIRFAGAIKKLGIPHIRFHDLRHYAASIMHAIGIPDVYIMQRGGWGSDSTLKRIYRGSIDDYQKMYTQSILKHIDDMQHEMQHKKISP